MSQKILVVDDEKKIVEIIRAYLEKEGYQVIEANDGKTALQKAREHLPDLIILDLMLPAVSGLDVCRQLRSQSNVPIIMLTARDDVTDKIVGLELGADDYMTKPFDPKELVSRVKAVLRRTDSQPSANPLLKTGDISIDLQKRTVLRGDLEIELTPIEFDLLSTMAANTGRVFSRAQLLDKVQGVAYEGYERTIDSHIKNLRKKIEPDLNQPRYIVTVYGVGYKIPEKSDA